MFDYWEGMPRFVQNKQKPYHKALIITGHGDINVRFDKYKDWHDFCDRIDFIDKSLFGSYDLTSEIFISDRGSLNQILDQKITDKTKSVWYPYKPHSSGEKEYYDSIKCNPRYPIFVVSKGRWDNGLTTKALADMCVHHYIIVEIDEIQKYEETANDYATILHLPKAYLDRYNTCDNLGDSKSKGPGAARNFAKDVSKLQGHKKHWVMDDNLDAFHYLTDNKKLETLTPFGICATEDFVDRYKNVPVAGLNYYSFAKSTDAVPPVVFNTRIYSCLLIDNSFDYEWRGRYNEDTDLSLRVLKDGFCTIQMNAFLCGKVTTQRMKGGNTKEFYSEEGTKPKSQMLEDLHPDVAKVVWRFNRWHHHVDYKPFKENKLELKGNWRDFGFVDYNIRRTK